MSRDEMIALAERCEKATGVDLDAPNRRALANEIGKAVGAVFVFGHAPDYLSSLDAALTLVPEGWDWAVGTGRRQHMTENGRRPWAWCARGDGFAMPEDYPLAATPALALTAASLRALAQTQPDNSND